MNDVLDEIFNDEYIMDIGVSKWELSKDIDRFMTKNE
jgi:hypothetical protein